MRTKLSLATAFLLLCASTAAAAPKESASVPTTTEAFDKLVAQLKVEAEAFAKAGDDKGPELSSVVKGVQYTKESAQPLFKTLSARSGPPLEELYIAYQLLQPLKMADNDAIRPTKPVLLRLFNTRCQYRPMPRWPQQTLATLNPPPNMPPDQLMKQMETIQKLRREKTQAEQPLVKHNRAVRALETTLKSLLAMLDETSCDEILLKRLAQEERDNLLTYEDTLSAIKAEIGDMKQPRAKMLYEQVKAMALNAGGKKRYTDSTRPNYSITGNSAFAQSEPQYFAISAMQVVNLLATPAKEPAVPIPDVKKWEEEQKRRREQQGHERGR